MSALDSAGKQPAPPVFFARTALIMLFMVLSAFAASSVQLAAQAVTSPYPPGYYSKKNPLFVLHTVDVRPEPLNQEIPELPPELKERKHAVLVVEYVIRKDGAVEFPQILASNDFKFNPFLMATAKLWKFKPALKNGKPVNCRVSQRFEFN